MVDGVENPYRTDRLADRLFVGREALITELARSAAAGRNSIHAVMGGRGMGKSSLARQLERRLARDLRIVVTAGGAERAVAALSKAVGAPLDGALVERLTDGLRTGAPARTLLILDEVERILEDDGGIGLLDNLREVYERADGLLALVVLGGTSVQDLLRDSASPFLRIAGGVHTLTGLTLPETARLVCEPLDLAVGDGVVEALHAETAGHPWLVQMFMEGAVDMASTREAVERCLPLAMHEAERRRLRRVAFPLWWSNLKARGQEVYQRLAREAGAVPRARWVERFGDDPVPWIDVLCSTGVASSDGGEVVARGSLFRRWVVENHVAASAHGGDNSLAIWLAEVGADPFEAVVVRALATWAQCVVEFPAAALKPGAGQRSDNSVLLPEAYFQIQALHALLQHGGELTAQPEALSVRPAGRSDIKVQSRQDPARRACVEFKVFSRDDATVVRQVIGYTMPGDSFAAVVSVDRCRRPVLPEYEARCFDGAQAATRAVRPQVHAPALLTTHERVNAAPLRVWHFLLQLRDA